MSTLGATVKGYAWDFRTDEIPSEMTPGVTMEDLESVANQIRTGNHPLILEHRHPWCKKDVAEPYAVGSLVGAEIDREKKTIKVESRLHNNARGREVQRGIQTGLLNGFSLGIRHSAIPGSDNLKFSKQFIECSIVAKPAHAPAVITDMHEVKTYASDDIDEVTKKNMETLAARLAEIDRQEGLQIFEEAENQKIIPATPKSFPEETKTKNPAEMSTDEDKLATIFAKLVNTLQTKKEDAPPKEDPPKKQPAAETMQIDDQEYNDFVAFQRFKQAQKQATPPVAVKKEAPAEPAPVPAPMPDADTISKLVNEALNKRIAEEEATKAKRKAEEVRSRETSRVKTEESAAAVPPQKKADKFQEIDSRISTMQNAAPAEPTQFQQRLNAIKAAHKSLADKRAQVQTLQQQPEIDSDQLQTALVERSELEKSYHVASTNFVRDLRSDLSQFFAAQGQNMPESATDDLLRLENSTHLPISALESAMSLHTGVSVSSAATRSSLDQIVATQKELAITYAKAIQKQNEDLEIQKTRHDRSAAQLAQNADAKARIGMAIDGQTSQQHAASSAQATVAQNSLADLAKAISVEMNVQRFDQRNGTIMGKTANFAGFDSNTGRPVFKESSKLSFTEMTGLPFELADESKTEVQNAAATGLPKAFRQKKRFNRVSEAGMKEFSEGGLEPLFNIFSTGNGGLADGLYAIEAAPETGRPLIVDERNRMPMRSNKWNTVTQTIGDQMVQFYDISSRARAN
jgi:hypothetical protein